MDFRKVSDGDGMKEISYDELKEAARPLMELLRKKGNMESYAGGTYKAVDGYSYRRHESDPAAGRDGQGQFIYRSGTAVESLQIDKGRNAAKDLAYGRRRDGGVIAKYRFARVFMGGRNPALGMSQRYRKRNQLHAAFDGRAFYRVFYV